MKPLLVLLAMFSIVPTYAVRTVLSGTVTMKATSGTLSMYYYRTILDEIEQRHTDAEVKLSKGRYKFVMDLERPVKVYLRDGEHWLSYENYIAPGDSLVLSFADSSSSFDGSCGDCNAMLFAKSQITGQLIAEREIAEKGDFNQWMSYAQKWLRGALRMPDTFAWEPAIPPMFGTIYRAETEYDYASDLLRMSWPTPGLMRDSAYLSHLRQIRFDDPSVLNSGHYIHFLRELPYSTWRAMYYSETDSLRRSELYHRHQQIRDSVARSVFKGEVLDVARYHLYNDRLKGLEMVKNTPLYAGYYKTLDSDIRAQARSFSIPAYPQRITARLKAMSARKPAPDFTLRDMNGSTVRLSDFRGKVVYVDFWATNCAPCVAEIPAAVALQRQFAGKDVVFLFVSLGDRLAELKPFLHKKGFSGKHLVEPLGFASKVAGIYGISSIPRYLLVDRQGMLASENAPRPSMSPEQQIEYLLQKQ